MDFCITTSLPHTIKKYKIKGLKLTYEKGDTHIHNLALVASWAAKYSGLSDRAAVDLVSRNMEKILDLDKGKSRDFVIWERNPLEFGASVVLAVDGDTNEIMECWPEAV